MPDYPRTSAFATLPYPDRKTAGRVLASLLQEYSSRNDVIVLALPRGGVPVASEVATALGCSLDVLVVRKLGAPWQPELAVGAIAPGDIVVLNPDAEAYFGKLGQALAPVIETERRELKRRETVYRRGRPPLEVRGRVAIVVDDGMATGSTMEAAVLALRALEAASIVLAVPVAPAESIDRLSRRVDQVVCPQMPAFFDAVGRFYLDFPQLTDAEVQGILQDAATRSSAAPRHSMKAPG